MSARRAWALTALLLLTACGRTTAPPDASPRTGAAASSSAAPSAQPSASEAALPPLLGEGCQSGVSLAGSSAEVLARVAAACAPDAVALELSPATLTLEAGKPAEAKLHVADPSACLRVAGVCGSGDLGLSLLDTHGKSVAADSLPGPIALVATRGPVCVREAGDYVVRVAGAGPVVLGAWRAR